MRTFLIAAILAPALCFAEPDAKEVFSRGEQKLAERNWSAAAKQFEKAVELEKNYAEAWSLWGEAIHNEGEIFEAVTKFKHAVAINPRFTKAWYNLGLGYENLHLEKKLKEDEKARKKISKTQFKNAVEAYQRALAISPMNDERAVADSHFRLGVVLRDMELKKDKKAQNFKGSTLHLEAAIKMFPDFPECRNELGRVYDIIGRYPDAIDQFTKAIEGHKYFAQAYSNRGVSWWHDGNWDNALADARKAVEIDPRFAGGHYNLAEVVFARVQELKTDKDRALVHLEVEKAIDEYKAAVALDPAFMDAWFGLAKAYRAYHDFDSAEATYDKILEMDKKLKGAKQGLKELKVERKKYLNHIPKEYLPEETTKK